MQHSSCLALHGMIPIKKCNFYFIALRQQCHITDHHRVFTLQILPEFNKNRSTNMKLLIFVSKTKSIIRTDEPILMESIDQVNTVIIFLSQMALLKACVHYFSLFLKEQCASCSFRAKYFEKKYNLQLLYLPTVS